MDEGCQELIAVFLLNCLKNMKFIPSKILILNITVKSNKNALKVGLVGSLQNLSEVTNGIPMI